MNVLLDSIKATQQVAAPQRAKWRTRAAFVVAVGIAAATASCSDPYRDARIEALGDEQGGFEPSEIHRVGQPCLACHDGYGPGEPVFSFGGTIFAEPVEGEPLILLPGYTVRLIDSEGQIRDIETNRCGNFYVEKENYDPAFPVRAEVFGPATPESENIVQLRVMSTRIGRDGSCGTCHIHPASPFSPGVAFVPGAYLDSPENPEGCPEPRFAEPL